MNLYYDVSSMLISLVLIVYFGVSKKLKSYQNGLFFVMIIMNFLSSVADYLKYSDTLLGLPNSYLFTEIFYCSNVIVILIMYIYVLSLAINWFALKTSKKIMTLAPAIIMIILLLINPVTSWVFEYVGTEYHRSNGLILLYVMGLYYFVATLLVILIYKNQISFFRRIAIFVGLCIIGLSVFIQYYSQETRIQVFAVAFGQLILFFTVRNPRDYIDNATGLYNRKAFKGAMDQHILTHTFFDLVIIALPDMKSGNYIDQGKCDNVLEQIGDFINDDILRHTVYRISDQALALEFKEEDENVLQEFMVKVINRFKEPFQFGSFESLCRCKLMHMSVPEDVDDLTELEVLIKKMMDDKSDKILVDVKDYDYSDRMLRKIQIEKTLTNAMNDEEMSLSFYPVFSLKEQVFEGAESYPFYNGDETGIIDPDEVTDYAGEQVHQFKKWEDIFSDTCDFLVSEKAKNVKFLFVPYDSLACVRASEIKRYLEIARDKKVDMSKLVFFVSEYVVSKAYNIIKNDIEECRKSGVRFGVKDYGNGFTDIETIYGLRLDIIAISKNLSRDAVHQEKAAIALESVIDLAKALNMKTLLRGISDEASANLVSRMKCDYVLGDYYSELLEEQDFIKLMNNQDAPGKGGQNDS